MAEKLDESVIREGLDEGYQKYIEHMKINEARNFTLEMRKDQQMRRERLMLREEKIQADRLEREMKEKRETARKNEKVEKVKKDLVVSLDDKA